jgi:Major Facilitator Superfamily
MADVPQMRLGNRVRLNYSCNMKFKSTPALWLMIAQFAMQLSFAAWWAMLNNFAVEVVQASGPDIGLVQSVREIPGLLAFTAILWLMVIREQNLALTALFLQGIGIFVTAFYPSLSWLVLTTLINSFGFHYYETMNQSLALQWLDKKTAPVVMGKIVAVGAVAQLLAYGAVAMAFGAGKMAFLADYLPHYSGVSYNIGFMVAGLVTIVTTALLWLAFPRFKQPVEQNIKMRIHSKYWLFYALTFMQGARRQIFSVFSGFMLVYIFKYSVAEVALLFFINGLFNMVIAPKLGGLISRFGERWSLMYENILLILVFLGYAYVAFDATPRLAWLAGVLFCIDGISTTLGIAIKTYFQKIGDPADMASQAGVAFSINHIAAVALPLALGIIWATNPPLVFLVGVIFAVISLILSRFVPILPSQGQETAYARFNSNCTQ